MSEWLMLRGEWDKNNKQNLHDDTDFWIQLFAELVGSDSGTVWYLSKKKETMKYRDNIKILASPEPHKERYTHIFARGAFKYYLPILRKNHYVYRIRYGAGERFVPELDIKYDLVLVDTEQQKNIVKAMNNGVNVHVWTKPAARQFVPIECKKEYDVCYIADCHSEYQADFKRVRWVYKTAPAHLKILHLGKSHWDKQPDNVTVIKVLRKEMPCWINKCRVGIVPYKEKDSAPRAMSEMIACGIPVFQLHSVQIFTDKLKYGKSEIWNEITKFIKDKKTVNYELNSIEFVAKQINHLIGCTNG